MHCSSNDLKLNVLADNFIRDILDESEECQSFSAIIVNSKGVERFSPVIGSVIALKSCSHEAHSESEDSALLGLS